MIPTNILEIRGLFKSFGAVKVIEGLDFTVPEGSIYGFVGVNGAGKTTTMKMVLGLLKLTTAKSLSAASERIMANTLKMSDICRMFPSFTHT